MAKVTLSKLVEYCDRTLRTAEVQDYERAANGLQVENSGKVTRIAAAVDGSLATVRMATEQGADLMIVHHGLFWGPSHPWTGKRNELMRLLLERDVAVDSSHLPLDAHPTLGNNAQLCAALGLCKTKAFFFERGMYLDLQARVDVDRGVLAARLAKATQFYSTNPETATYYNALMSQLLGFEGLRTDMCNVGLSIFCCANCSVGRI